MAQTEIDTGEFVGDFLEHFGVKGMRWGVRRTREERAMDKAQKKIEAKKVKIEVTEGNGIKTKGGKRRTASDDAIVAAVGKQIAKKSGTDALSNEELKRVVERMNLESQFAKLSKGQKSKGEEFVDSFMKNLAPTLLKDIATDGKKDKKKDS